MLIHMFVVGKLLIMDVCVSLINLVNLAAASRRPHGMSSLSLLGITCKLHRRQWRVRAARSSLRDGKPIIRPINQGC